MAKCLVTGAAGFIGSHLCERLINDGHQVIGFDDLSTGRRENLPASFNFVHGTVVTGDVFSSIDWKDWKLFEGLDWVFHLAAKADVVPSIEYPNEYHDVNVTGTVKMLEHARKSGVKRFIYAASSSCYGIPDVYPTPETAPCKPMYPYALTKYLGEQCVMHWDRVYSLPCVSLRLFNVYGPRARTSGSYGAVFGTFLAQLANDKAVTIVGDGYQARDFTYVTDVVDAFVKAAESDVTGECINIGSGHCYTVNHLANLLGAKDVVHIPDRPGEPRKTLADRKKATYLLDWDAEVSFEYGVSKMKKLIPQYKDAPLWAPESIAKATETWFKCLGEKQ